MRVNSSPVSLPKRVKGWIFDVYPSNPGEVAVWVIGENGERVRFTDKFQSKIYVSGKQENIERLGSRFFSSQSIVSWDFVYKYAHPTDAEKSTVLDSVESVDYTVPPFRTIKLNVEIAKKGNIANLKDPIDKLEVTQSSKQVIIDSGEEGEKLLQLAEAVRELDPDIILTIGGDSYLFPYLIQRATVNNVLDKFILSRDDAHFAPKTAAGRTFFSFGRHFHKAS